MKIFGFLVLSLPLIACAPGSVTDSTSESSSTDALSTRAVYETFEEVMQHALDAGLNCDHSVVVATAIAFAESSGNIHAVNHNHNGSTDYGLWQINSVHGMTRGYLFNVDNNANAMVDISTGGTKWSPWSTYTNGAYRKHMAASHAAFSNVCPQ